MQQQSRHSEHRSTSLLAAGLLLALNLTAAKAADESSALPAVQSAVLFDDSASIIVDEDRKLPLRVVFLPGEQIAPVVVLSHGTFSAGKKYDLVSSYWAERGYVVILPDHRDANYAETPTSEAHMLEIIDSRGRDLVAIADQLDEIAAQVPGLQGRLDASCLVSAGHSVGTQTALSMTGLRFRNPETGDVKGVAEERFCATILLSDPGKMALMPADVWKGGSQPVFMATGPDDYGLMGDGRRTADYQNEILESESPAEGSFYLLTIQGMDHQFGGLVHKDSNAEPDHEALALFLEMSTAFLDVYVQGDESALPELLPRQVSERATLTIE
jgi:dienelactone hydrolase